MKPKIKIITGYAKDQYEVIDASEAHKAYYLFLNPEKRGVFANGVALRGQDIVRIVPAWNETMHWNPTHTIDNDDWNELRAHGIDTLLQHEILPTAREVAMCMRPEDMHLPLQSIAQKYNITQKNTMRIYGTGESIGKYLPVLEK